MDSFKPYLAKVATGAALTREEAREAFETLLSGEVTPSQAGGFLMALRVRGEAQSEIVVAPGPPLEPAHCLGAGKARCLLSTRGTDPGLVDLLVSDTVDRLEDGVQRQRRHR